jgi:hypothetical protein
MTAATRVQCPCCGYHTLSARGRDEIRQACYWHDDGQDDPRADDVWGGPSKRLSFTQARMNFRAFGAADRDCLAHVRQPRPEER